MKNHFKLILLLILSIVIISPKLINVEASENNMFMVSDGKNESAMPEKYRNIEFLNISGSGQFTPNQLPNLIQSLSKDKILDIDLRQESHGFINNIAFSYAGNSDALNYGMSSNSVMVKEINDLEKIKLNSSVKIYNKAKKPEENLTVKRVMSEYDLATKNNIEYIRLAVKSNGIPSEDVVDNFINIVKNKPKDLHTHFHCDYGDGRTTLFMAMYQIMNNNLDLSLDEILKYQLENGGTELSTNKEKINFLNKFHNYVKCNKDNNYEVAYSNWKS